MHVDDRPARNTSIHSGLGNGWRDDMDQTRIKRGRNDVIAPEGQLAAIGHRHLIRDILARQFRKGMGAGDLHLIIDGAGVDIQGPPEQIRKAKNVIDLIGVIRPTGGHDCVGADGMCLFRCDLGVGVGHSENNGVFRHTRDHFRRHGPFG